VNGPLSSELVVRLSPFPAPGVKAVTVRGKVTNLPASSYRQDPKVLLTRDAREGGGAVEAVVHEDGTFEFARVPAGSYTVSTAGLSSSLTSTLTVAETDIPDLAIALAGLSNPFPGQPGASLAPLFDMSQTITLRGVLTQEITQIRPPAPAMYFRMDVQDPATGIVKNWAILLSQTGARTPAAIPGIEKLKVGARITVMGGVSRDGSNRSVLVPIPGANTSVGLNLD
jgi:hypothetical protein